MGINLPLGEAAAVHSDVSSSGERAFTRPAAQTSIPSLNPTTLKLLGAEFHRHIKDSGCLSPKQSAVECFAQRTS
jgi:hypothetical protein